MLAENEFFFYLSRNEDRERERERATGNCDEVCHGMTRGGYQPTGCSNTNMREREVVIRERERGSVHRRTSSLGTEMTINEVSLGIPCMRACLCLSQQRQHDPVSKISITLDSQRRVVQIYEAAQGDTTRIPHEVQKNCDGRVLYM